MGDRDEFDSEDPAPVPPHERGWRHPAEVSDEKRRRHMFESAPPPVGRRVTALVALVSVAASGVILMVTLPKGLDSRPATEPAVRSTTSSVPAKGSSARRGVVLLERLVATTGTFKSGALVTDGGTVTARAVGAPAGHGLVLLSTDTQLTAAAQNDLTDEEFRYLGDEGQLVLRTADGSVISTRLGISTENADKWWPLAAESAFDSVARILDREGNLVGIAVCEHGSTWAMKLADVLALVSRAGANAGQDG